MSIKKTILNIFSKFGQCSYVYDILRKRFLILKQSKLRTAIASLTLDILLGCIVYQIFNYVITTNEIDVVDWLLASRDKTRELLKDLIGWLMGVPAGLKLNRELSHFLGKFFLSHIYVWMGYLHILETYLPELTFLLKVSSYFGLTVIVSIINDIINVLTCHMYCFYVYAAKLYCTQLQTLISLGRLFVGKKWNVLRLRVDSVTYEADQLILGTILFTILLFLLPTSLLYYIVFTSLRMTVLVVQTLLGRFIHVLLYFPTTQEHILGHTTIVCDNEMTVGVADSCDVFGVVKELCMGRVVRPWSTFKKS